MAPLCLLLAAACAGSVGDGGEGLPGEAPEAPRSGAGPTKMGSAETWGMPGAGPGTPGQGAQPGAQLPDPGAAAPERMASAACKGVEPGPTFIRRLTRAEYDNTVRDLLGDTSAPARSFAVEPLSHGFDNEAITQSATPVLIEDYFSAAERLASTAVDKDANALAGCDPAKLGEDACAMRFFETFGRRAYRRPLVAGDTQILASIYGKIKATSGWKAGLKAALTTMLASVHFLYRVEFGEPAAPGATSTRLTQAELATRLSYLLWRSTPDAALQAAVDARQFATREQIDAQVARLLADPRARGTVSEFHEQWLQLRALDGIEKDTTVYPTFRSQVPGLMKQEALRFLDHVVWEDQGTMSALYLAPFTFADATLAKFYGLPMPSGTGLQKLAITAQPRAGLLTLGGVLAVQAQPNQTHPVRRGAFVRQALLCEVLPPPPDGVDFTVPPPSKTLSGRERFVKHREDPACSGCHTLTDPIGFGFEAFDGVGLYRTTENGKPIDTSGEVVGLEGGGKFNGPAELGALLGRAPKAAGCLVQSWFRYGYGRDLAGPADECSVDVLERAFAARSFKITDLVAALTRTDAFQYRHVVIPGGAP